MIADAPRFQYDQDDTLGQNWRVQFIDQNDIPLNMLSFEDIDFGATSYKEIFQNVKTILATPLWSAALERTLGVDGRIVDLPNNVAEYATIAFLNAITQWEPRAQVMEIQFDQNAAQVLSGHLPVGVKLRIHNVIFGSPIQSISAAGALADLQQSIVLVPSFGSTGAEGATGAPGETGRRGSFWFTGPTDPAISEGVLPNDMFLNTTSGDVFQFDGATLTWRKA